MTPNEKAERAKILLADPAMDAAFSDIRMALVLKLESAPVGDVDTQHEIALMLQLLKRIRTQLESYVQDQKMIQHRQKQDTFIQKMRQRIA